MYLALVEEYASDEVALSRDFAYAWYKLTSRDMGPVTRCMGADVPAAQEFQMPLPEADTVSFHHWMIKKAKWEIEELFTTVNASIIEADTFGETSSYTALFINLAFQCMASFRSTDYFGGCNGAMIRFSPQSEWADNVGMDLVRILAMCLP